MCHEARIRSPALCDSGVHRADPDRDGVGPPQARPRLRTRRHAHFAADGAGQHGLGRAHGRVDLRCGHLAAPIPVCDDRQPVVGVARPLRARRFQLLLGAPHRAPRALVLGGARQPSFEPALQLVDRTAAKLDWPCRAVVRVPHLAGVDRVRSGDAGHGRRAQHDLPVLVPHRGDRPLSRVVRGGDEHAFAPPRPSRHQPAVPRSQLRGRVHRVGPPVQDIPART